MANANAPIENSKIVRYDEATSVEIAKVIQDIESRNDSAENSAHGALGALHKRVVRSLLGLKPRRSTKSRDAAELEGLHPGRLLVKYYSIHAPSYLAKHVDEQDSIKAVDEVTPFNGYPCAEGLIDLQLGALGGILEALEDPAFEPSDKAYELYDHILTGAYSHRRHGGTRGAIAAVEIARDWSNDKAISARYQRLIDRLRTHLEADEKYRVQPPVKAN